MQVGLSFGNDAEGWAGAAELRPPWTKWGLQPGEDTDNIDMVVKFCENCRDLDIEPIIDLRADNIQQLTAMDEAYSDKMYAHFVDWTVRVVEQTKHLCQHWEVWGEAPCPYIAKGDFCGGRNYLDLMAAVYPAIKAVDPEARVWLSGHGVNFGLRFFELFTKHGGFAHYDVNNLHPFCHWRTWAKVEEVMRSGFGWMRQRERELGVEHKPLTSTEFGWPTTPTDFDLPLKSKFYSRVMTISETHAVEWFDKSLQLFKEEGMQVCIICQLHDIGPMGHWGSKCGLIREDGSRKKHYNVVAKWIDWGRDKAVTL